jgi:hypothetical protein
MFVNDYFPTSYYPPSYFPKTGALVRRGSSFAAGTRILMMLERERTRALQAELRERIEHSLVVRRLEYEKALARQRQHRDQAIFAVVIGEL